MIFNQQIITKTAEETINFGESLAKQLSKKGGGLPKIFCLYGELGSGKTTFAGGFAKGLGISSRLLSPTFIIVRRYDLPESSGFLYHLDLYRLKTMKELGDLGLSEIFSDRNSVVLIEWAEKLGGFLPKSRIDIRFNALEDGSHGISIENC